MQTFCLRSFIKMTSFFDLRARLEIQGYMITSHYIECRDVMIVSIIGRLCSCGFTASAIVSFF